MIFMSSVVKAKYTIEMSEKSELFHVIEWDLSNKVRFGKSLGCFDTQEEAADFVQCCYHDDVYELQHAEVL